MTTTIDILICTIDAGIRQVADLLLPPLEGVRYVVSMQYTDDRFLQDVPDVLRRRPDVSLTFLPGRGLSRNRNHVLDQSSADIVIITDDDVRFTPDGLDCVRRAYAEHPEVDIALFEISTPDGRPMKRYPQATVGYQEALRQGYYPSSCEITMRRAVVQSGLRFNECFGLGSAYFGSGEEDVLLKDACDRKLAVRFFPFVLLRTHAVTTGSRLLSDVSVQRAKGAALAYCMGRLPALVRCARDAAHWWIACRANPFPLFRHFCQGIFQKIPSQLSITIVIPYRNRAARLPRTLESVASCGWRPLRVVLVDNGSTDGSADICRRFKEQWGADDFEVTLVAEPTPGACAARNRGLALCRTEFVYFFDSDDLFDARFLPEVMPQLTADIDLLAVPTQMRIHGRLRKRVYRATDDPAAQLLLSHLSTQAMVLRTSFVRSIGGWNTQAQIWNDWELGLRLLLARPRLRWFTPHAFHDICVHTDSITGAGYAARADRILTTLRLARTDIESASLSATDRNRLLSALCLRHCIVTGQLMREKDMEAARLCRQQQERMMSSFPSAAVRRLVRFLTRYVALGVPGAWWIAWKSTGRRRM